jgi:hypothetical protein
MSMRYFTLSAVCMLVFSMLLALSGTTDFPGARQEAGSPSGSAFTAPDLDPPATGESMATVVPLPEDSKPQAAETVSAGDAVNGGWAHNRPLLFLGALFVAAWVLLSFKLFADAKG